MHVESYASPQAVPQMSVSLLPIPSLPPPFPLIFLFLFLFVVLRRIPLTRMITTAPLFCVPFFQPGKKKHKDKGKQLLITDAIFFLI